MLFAGKLSEQATVSVAGNSATVNHTTTNFTAYANVTSGTNTIPIIATDYSANSATNKYQVVVTNNGVAKTITFDLDGNETSVVTTTSTNTYQWDAANRLISITGPTNQSLFTFDGLGRRMQIIEKTNGVAYITNKFVWDNMELCQQRNSANGIIKQFIGDGEQISGTNYFFTYDHLGNVREMVDSSGTVQARYDYDPYGRRTKISGSLDADFAYAGYYYHSASGLYLTLYRAYDADLGRWLSRDPIGDQFRAMLPQQINLSDLPAIDPEIQEGPNLYEYVFNRPIYATDDFGLSYGGCIERYRNPLTEQLPNAIANWVVNRGGGGGGGGGDLLGWITAIYGAGNGIANYLAGLTGDGLIKSHPTTWQHKLGGWLSRELKDGNMIGRFGKAFGRVSVGLTIFEGFWDLGLLIGCIGN
jgi:RHS repeat-associated protein